MARVHRVVGRRLRHVLGAFAQPLLHEFDLVTLRDIDAARHVDQLLAVGAISRELGHFQRLVVMRNHVLHELHVGG